MLFIQAEDRFSSFF